MFVRGKDCMVARDEEKINKIGAFQNCLTLTLKTI